MSRYNQSTHPSAFRSSDIFEIFGANNMKPVPAETLKELRESSPRAKELFSSSAFDEATGLLKVSPSAVLEIQKTFETQERIPAMQEKHRLEIAKKDQQIYSLVNRNSRLEETLESTTKEAESLSQQLQKERMKSDSLASILTASVNLAPAEARAFAKDALKMLSRSK